MKKLYIQIPLIVICSIVFTTIIIQIPNPIFANVGSKDSWINFFGAITGGFLTLYGVWWTIKDQNEKRKEDFIIMNKPIITVSSVECKDLQACKKNTLDLNVKIKNCGKSEARNIKIFIHLCNEYKNDYCALCSPNCLNILLPSDEIDIQAQKMFLHEYEGVVGESFEVIINYQDLFNNFHISKQIISFDRSNLLNESGENILFNFNDLSLETGKLEFPRIQKNL